MADDVKISADADAGALGGSELIPVVKSGANKTTTPDKIATRAATLLGLGTAAYTAATAYDAAGAAAAVLGTSLQKASNLSDVGDVATARSNLGLAAASAIPNLIGSYRLGGL